MCIKVIRYACGVEKHQHKDDCDCTIKIYYLPLTRNCEVCQDHGVEESAFMKQMEASKAKGAEKNSSSTSSPDDKPIPSSPTEPLGPGPSVRSNSSTAQLGDGRSTIHVGPQSRSPSIFAGDGSLIDETLSAQSPVDSGHFKSSVKAKGAKDNLENAAHTTASTRESTVDPDTSMHDYMDRDDIQATPSAPTTSTPFDHNGTPMTKLAQGVDKLKIDGTPNSTTSSNYDADTEDSVLHNSRPEQPPIITHRRGKKSGKH